MTKWVSFRIGLNGVNFIVVDMISSFSFILLVDFIVINQSIKKKFYYCFVLFPPEYETPSKLVQTSTGVFKLFLVLQSLTEKNPSINVN